MFNFNRFNRNTCLRIIRFIKALVKYALHGHRVEFGDYVLRLRMCNGCPYRDEFTCKKCGCFLDKKCKMDTEKCPNGNW